MDGGILHKDATNATELMYRSMKCVNGAMKEYFVKIVLTRYKIWDARAVYHICLTLLSMPVLLMTVAGDQHKKYISVITFTHYNSLSTKLSNYFFIFVSICW